jgi:methylmalonyl-CoA mutase C-terminal domain/subunit
MNEQDSPQRIVLAKIGLDGHDRGIKVVARGLRDAGFHVIYSGLWQAPEAVIQAVIDEDADWLGISLLSGAHMTLIPELLRIRDEQGAGDVGVIVGGIVPDDDAAKLREMGVATVFGPGTPIQDIVDFMKRRKNRVEHP